ncbi:MAG: TRAP transporter small permease [Pseudomonadota bacterium]
MNAVKAGLPLRPLWRVLRIVEDGTLVCLLLLMILLAVVQIVLRNFADQSLLWADPFLRVSVLWIGLLGAGIAARENSHIAIDIATRYLPERLARVSGVVLSLFAAGVCGVFAWVAFVFVRSEYDYGAMAFGSVPAWWCESIMPAAFALMAVRYLGIGVGLTLGHRPIRKDGI